MKNIINFVKEKSYYFLGGTVLIIVIFIVINIIANNSGGAKSYDEVESKMINAAKNYYVNKADLLPQEEGDSTSVSVSALVEAELMEKIVDPNNKSNTCTGQVDVVKTSSDYNYIPLLNCPGNYETKYLKDVIKTSKLDEYGNGIYEMNGEYVYRGDDVKNYMTFNNQKWRIIKVDEDGDIELIYYNKDDVPSSSWDGAYNSDTKANSGVTTNYLQTSIRKVLNSLYESNFSDIAKSRIASKDICVGTKTLGDAGSEEEECSIKKEKERIGLLRVSDYTKASLDEKCTIYSAPECTNRNYLAASHIETWLLTSVADNTYQAYFLRSVIRYDDAYEIKDIYPVIYLSKNSIILSGNGTANDPYRIK